MTLTFSVPVKRLPGQLVETQTQVTIDATYATGGIALTPQQLGHGNAVVAGSVSVRTSAGNVSGGTLDCTTPTAPKLKLQASATTTAELGAGVGSGAVLDVTALGY